MLRFQFFVELFWLLKFKLKMLCIDLQNRACIYYSLDSDGLVEGTTISASPEELPPGHTRRPCPAVLGAMLHSSPASGVCSSELTLLTKWVLNENLVHFRIYFTCKKPCSTFSTNNVTFRIITASCRFQNMDWILSITSSR